MAFRHTLLRGSPQASALRNVIPGLFPLYQARTTTLTPLLLRTNTRHFSRTPLKHNYNHGYNNYPPPAAEPTKPSRSTTFFRIVNSLSGLAIVYLLYVGVDALEVLTGTVMQMEANHARDHFDAQLERVRSEEMTARDRDYERRLLRWRQVSRGDMVDLDEHMR